MHNYFADPALAEEYELLGRPFQAVIYRLDALLVVLKECKGTTCTDPWKVHGEKSLIDALHPALDSYFLQQPKVGFSSCELGYIKEAEGNQRAIDFGTIGWRDEQAGQSEQQVLSYGRWHDWV